MAFWTNETPAKLKASFSSFSIPTLFQDKSQASGKFSPVCVSSKACLNDGSYLNEKPRYDRKTALGKVTWNQMPRCQMSLMLQSSNLCAFSFYRQRKIQIVKTALCN